MTLVLLSIIILLILFVAVLLMKIDQYKRVIKAARNLADTEVFFYMDSEYRVKKVK